MPAISVCPDLQQLQQLLLGRLAGPTADQLEEHLAQCNHCLAAAQTFREEDTFTEAARTPLPADLEASEGALVSKLMERLSHLGSQSGATPGPVSAPPTDPPQSLESTREEYAFLSPAQAAGELGWLGPYRVLQQLGMGGMGIVFLAEDSQLQRRVALKVMKPALALDGSARQRFLREARTAAAVKHDHVVIIHQVGEERGVPYLAMELLDGEPLDRRLQGQGPLPLADVLHIGREAAEGLAAAHKRGLIHRDLKPSNIWLETRDSGEEPGARRYRVKLIDFGLARSVEGGQLTQQGLIVGTPSYMAPEQANGEPVDARCDLFSLGCVLYRLCTGRLPFKRSTNMATLKSLATDQPVPPRTLNPAIPPALDDLVMRLLAKNSDDRPATARAVIEALDAIERTPVPPAPVESTTDVFQAPTDELVEPQPQHPGRGKTRMPWLVAAATAFLVLGPLSWFYGADVVRFATNKGELVIVTDDPNIEVTVNKDGKPTIHDKVKDRRFVLTAGDYEVEVREEGDGGVRFTTKKFTITRGGKEVLNATLELAKVEPTTAEPGSAVDPDRRVAEWVINTGGYVLLNDGNRTPAKTVKQLPPQPFKLFAIALSGEKAMEGGGLDNLHDVTDLSQFHVEDVPLKNEDVERLTKIPGLKGLDAFVLRGENVRVTNDCLVHLRQLPKLRIIELATSRITDDGLKQLYSSTG